jgi:phage FluMu protein Com
MLLLIIKYFLDILFRLYIRVQNEKCKTINVITLEEGVLEKEV